MEKKILIIVCNNTRCSAIAERPRKIADFEPIIARSASAVTPSEKVQLMLIGSLLYALSNEPKMIVVRYP